MLNVRLSEDLEKKLKQYSMEENVPKSSIVKEALAQYFTKKELKASPFAVGSGLFGLEGSGRSDGSVTYKKTLKDKLNAKHSH